MDLAAVVSGLLNGAGVLAKEMGKGGGGSTEEPTVCISLLPIGLGVLVLGVAGLRRRLAGYTMRAPGGRATAPVPTPERKVQTA